MKLKKLHKPATFAELHERLGFVPLSRIQLDSPPGLATEDDVIRIAVSKSRPVCELLDRTLVEKAHHNWKSIQTAHLISLILGFVHINDLGIVVGPTCAFRLKSGSVIFPDISFIPWDAFPNGEIPKQDISAILPELAVKVLLPENTVRETERFVRELFESGTKRIWILNYAQQFAADYESPTHYKMIMPGESLTGGNVLPGFSLSLSKLFSYPTRAKKKKGLTQ